MVSISDEDVSRRVHAKTMVVLELTVSGPKASPSCNENSLARELLDSVVPRLRDINVPQRANPDPVRVIELTRAGARNPPFQEETSIGSELLDPIVPGVCDIDAPVEAHGYAVRTGELPIPGSIGSPLQNKLRSALADSEGSHQTNQGYGNSHSTPKAPKVGPVDLWQS